MSQEKEALEDTLNKIIVDKMLVIKDLESQLSSLREENERLQNSLIDFGARRVELAAERDNLLAEIDRLKSEKEKPVFTCRVCGEHEKYWSRKNNDWYCKTCGHICNPN